MQQSYGFQGSLDLRRNLAGRHPPLLEPEGNIPPDGHVRPQRIGLKDHADVTLPRRQVRDIAVANEDAAARCRPEAGNRAQQRRLTRPGRTKESKELARFDHHVDAFQHLCFTKRQVQVLDPDPGLGLCHLLFSET